VITRALRRAAPCAGAEGTLNVEVEVEQAERDVGDPRRARPESVPRRMVSRPRRWPFMIWWSSQCRGSEHSARSWTRPWFGGIAGVALLTGRQLSRV